MDTAEAYIEAKKLRAKGKSLDEIAQQLSKLGFKSQRTKKAVTDKGVSYLLLKSQPAKSDVPKAHTTYEKVGETFASNPLATGNLMVIIGRPDQIREFAQGVLQ